MDGVQEKKTSFLFIKKCQDQTCEIKNTKRSLMNIVSTFCVLSHLFTCYLMGVGEHM